MVPTMIVFGLIIGRWWPAALLAGALIWPAMVLSSDAMELQLGLLAAALFGLANTAVGVGIHQGILAVVRNARTSERISESS